MPRLVSCLVKGPLGCLAFALGAAVVVVLLLPPAGGRIADKFVQEHFDERHLGSLEIADAWIGSLYGPQRIESITLRDPDGEEVLRASLTAPEIGPLFEALFDGQPGNARYGPVRIDVASLRIVEGRDGRTNLERALEPRLRDRSRSRREIETDRDLALPLDVGVERLRWIDAGGRDGELQRVELAGELVWGVQESRLVLEGGPVSGEAGTARLKLDVVWRHSEADGPASVALELSDVPSDFAALACAAFRPLARFAGPSVGKVEWKRDGSRVELDVEDEGADLDLDGRIVGDDGRGGERGDVAGDEAALRLTLPCDDPRAGELVALLLPVLEPPQCAGEPAPHELVLARCRWPLDGAWSRLGGELELALAPSRAALVTALVAPGGTQGASIVLLDGLRARAGVEAGTIEYASLRLPTETGFVDLTGRVEVGTGAVDLTLTGEAAGGTMRTRLVGERGGLAPALEDALVPPSAVEPPAMPAPPLPDAPSPGAPAAEPRESPSGG